MLIFSSLWDIVESKTTSDRHTMSILCAVMKAFIEGTFTKLWTASSFKFQWQNLIADGFLGPGFISMWPDFSSTWNVRILVMLIQFVDIYTSQKMKFSIKDCFSKCDQIRRKLRIWSHSLKKSLMENFILCAVIIT